MEGSVWIVCSNFGYSLPHYWTTYQAAQDYMDKLYRDELFGEHKSDYTMAKIHHDLKGRKKEDQCPAYDLLYRAAKTRKQPQPHSATQVAQFLDQQIHSLGMIWSGTCHFQSYFIKEMTPPQ